MIKKKGQIMIGAILLLVILAVLVPAMVRYVQNEARWSTKQGQNSNAFQLAEAALDRGYQKVTESTNTWVTIQAGTQLTGFKFDTSYTELSGGSYAISITSGPGSQVVTIVGVGRDKNQKEVRALQAVYANSPLGANAIQSGNTLSLSGSNEVEWGSVVSANQITIPVATNHPQFYSAANIVGKDSNGSTPPNTDSVQWYSYYSAIPPAPYIDFDFYKSSAIATGTCISESAADQALGCTNSGISACGASGWSGGGDHDCSTGAASKACKGYAWYINCPTNGITITSNNNSWLTGTMIVIGNLTVQASAASGTESPKLPQIAWKQYGNDWAYYLTNFGNGCSPAENTVVPSFPGLTSSHLSPVACTKTLSNVLLHGFLYVSGNASFQSGGVARVIGGAYIVGSTSVAAGGYIVYSDPLVSQNLITTRLVLSRASWQDSLLGWPPALP